MNYTATNRRTIFFIALVSLTLTSNAQVVASLNTNVSEKSNVDFGFNRRSDRPVFFGTDSFISLLEDLNPDIIRYPGGTQANYWDWRTGQFLENTDKPTGNQEMVTIPDFVSTIPERTKAIYVINLARPTPATGIPVTASEAVLKSEKTLDAKILDMIDAIDEFTAQGKTPYAIELGNEFYFGNEESGIFETVERNGLWYSGFNPATQEPYESTNKKEAIEISASFYVEQCQKVVAAIKADYPDIKIAIINTKSGNGRSARESWNNTVNDELLNNPDYAQLATQIDAVTQHHYLNDEYGNQMVINDLPSAEVAIAEGIQYPIDKNPDYNMVPNPYQLWITEYGATKNNANETWASGVRYAALLYSWLTRGDKIGQLHYHHLTDENVINNDGTLRLAPIGIAAKTVAEASAGMDTFQQIEFENNPIADSGFPALYGLKFRDGSREKLLIINIGRRNINPIDISALFDNEGTITQTRHHSNEPFVFGVADGDSNIVSNTSVVDDQINIRKFSVNVLEASGTLSSSSANIRSVGLFPNPASDILNIETPAVIQSITIYGLDGKLIRAELTTEKSLNVQSLSNGLYIIKLTTNNGTESIPFLKN
ncbi:Por secretion system C-terminal sorting domain-containing protein [Nonlabens sp. Hel1_33_55]|uniref:T9SS type A sorting domain-containing protein n=1 Tax=Nonlabens sp. Hel1_33_55 TaxID=1336802 RepID=UPI000875C027|nr:T9SS type A sorting domain-containing protein [Nonlabens sp. Hel1_33_55]SCX99748.1 Por secretion system C-terminal sorting domain-containing protein [Nonlabens sp. Hel1_33_55]